MKRRYVLCLSLLLATSPVTAPCLADWQQYGEIVWTEDTDIPDGGDVFANRFNMTVGATAIAKFPEGYVRGRQRNLPPSHTTLPVVWHRYTNVRHARGDWKPSYLRGFRQRAGSLGRSLQFFVGP